MRITFQKEPDWKISKAFYHLCFSNKFIPSQVWHNLPITKSWKTLGRANPSEIPASESKESSCEHFTIIYDVRNFLIVLAQSCSRSAIIGDNRASVAAKRITPPNTSNCEAWVSDEAYLPRRLIPPCYLPTTYSEKVAKSHPSWSGFFQALQKLHCLLLVGPPSKVLRTSQRRYPLTCEYPPRNLWQS